LARNGTPQNPLPDVSFRFAGRAVAGFRYATIATVAQCLLKIAIDDTLKAPSVIDDPTSVLIRRQRSPPVWRPGESAKAA
jgi:hypothetical protein